MKNKTVLILIGIFFTSCLFAQTYKFEYDYDNAGNRIKRYIINLKKNQAKDAKIDTLIDTQNNYEITVFPNPVNEVLTIHINNMNTASSQTENPEQNFYEICDISGKLLIRKELKSDTEEIDFQRFTVGMYILRLHFDSNIKEYKIVKQN